MKFHHSSVAALFCLFFSLVYSCIPETHALTHPAFDPSKLAYENNLKRRSIYGPRRKVAIRNVRVFDGNQLGAPSTVVIDGKHIGKDPKDAEQIDGRGGVLIPGLIDSHNHVKTVEDLEELSGFGVTTTMMMACLSIPQCHSVQGHVGLTDVHIAGLAAIAPNSEHAIILNIPDNETLSGPSQAADFVGDQVASGAAFIKLIAEDPGSPTLSQVTLDTIVHYAHQHEKLTACHAASKSAVGMALKARVNQVHHSPLDTALDASDIEKYVKLGALNVPTLVAMQGFSVLRPNISFYGPAKDSVTALSKVGIPILAGTDAIGNLHLTAIPYIPFGDSLHTELELLVQAGLSTVDALRAATVLPARHFRLPDRGLIEPGRRADLVLLSGDPIADIRATRSIERIWIEGIEYDGVKSSSNTSSSS